MKKELGIFVFGILILSVLFSGVVSAEDFPFEIEKVHVFFDNPEYNGLDILELTIKNNIFFNHLSSFHEIPSYNVYLNGVELSSGSLFYMGDYNLVKSSSTSSIRFSSESEFASLDFLSLNLLEEGENKLVVTTSDLTVDDKGNFVKTQILEDVPGQEGDNAIVKDFYLGPDVGIETAFVLIREQIDSGEFELTNLSSLVPRIGYPHLNAQSPGELVSGRRVFVMGSGVKPSTKWNLYFNNVFVRELGSDSIGRIREEFLVNEEGIISGTNFIILQNVESRERIKSPIYFSEPEESSWKGVLWLNDTDGYYGDVISIYGAGFEANENYKLNVRYEGISGRSLLVTTNSLGQFEIYDYEINPPIFSDVILFAKHLFSERPEENLSSADLAEGLAKLSEVSIVISGSEQGGIGADFKLCDRASESLKRLGYCQ